MSIEEIRIRASSMPRVMACAASALDNGLRVDETNSAAALGTAVHEVLAGLARNGIDWATVSSTARRYGIDETELRVLANLGSQMWAELAPSFPQPFPELALSAHLGAEVYLDGHIDLVSGSAGVVRFLDWKSGRKDSDYWDQLMAYATLVLRDDPDVLETSATVVWLRDQEVEHYTITRAESDEWAARVVATVRRWDGVYHSGPQCRYCPRSHDCTAANAMVRRDIAAVLGQVEVPDLALMAPGDVIALAEQSAAVEKLACRVRDAIRLHVLDHGDIEANGQRLTIQTEERRELNPLKAWPLLDQAGFTDEDFAGVVKLSHAGVNKRIAQKAGRGKGAAAVRAFAEQLDRAGAVSVREIHKLVTRRAKKEAKTP